MKQDAKFIVRHFYSFHNSTWNIPEFKEDSSYMFLIKDIERLQEAEYERGRADMLRELRQSLTDREPFYLWLASHNKQYGVAPTFEEVYEWLKQKLFGDENET